MSWNIVQSFLSLDPLAMEFPAWSPYNYVLGNPVKLIDSDGRSPGDPIIKKLNTIVSTLSDKMTTRFNESFTPKQEKFIERGNAIVSTEDGNFALTNPTQGTEENGGIVKIDLTVDEGEKLEGDFHTHGLGKAKDEGGGVVITGMSFSTRDITDMFQKPKGFISIIDTGDSRDALVIIDPKKASKRILKQLRKIDKKYKKAMSKSKKKGNDYKKQYRDAVKKIVGESKKSGIGFYTTKNENKTEFEKVN